MRANINCIFCAKNQTQASKARIAAIITYTLLIFIAIGCALENKKSEDVKLTKRVFDLSDPAQKSEFDRWVNTNIKSVHNDTSANKYESRSKFNFTGEKFDLVSCDFEDSNFEVYSACSGEFGGSLLFIDKKDKEKIYVLSSICPKMIDFKEGKYIITSTLAHMSGSASVKILEDPRRLPLFQKDKFITRQIPTPDSLLENIIDTIGVTGNIYYPYKKKGFLIFSKYDTAYVGEVKKGEIINTQPLLNHGIWSYGDKMNKIKNEIYISEHTTGHF